ncbi:protein teflon isoform X1 [Drosophila pseudoobscura]|uniref:Protein teflon isoform X1 n=1 Tax=Drosophila pseudoobscura pseudoobscura TaxID=46245 RepID=A0A6I8UTN6_DROPS|nr:protein teflon isoform X1 [Drosophila pseudoobscura]
MSSFLDILGDGHVNFEKCGDVVVSPKDNMVAMFCHFCKDIFTHLPEFMRHLQWSHSDVLQFTKEQNVYRVEELMSLESSEDDVQSQANSCSSGDSGLAGEMEDADGEPGSSECLANNLEIMDALAAFDVDIDGLNNVSHEQSYSKTPPDSRTEDIGEKCAARNILAEVEAMLLEDEGDISPSSQTVQSVHCRAERKIQAEPIITETPVKKTYSKVNYTEKEIEAHSSKGFRCARKPGRVEKPPSICDLKSYNITRHSRKREAIKQRLSSVKKRIMRSLENDVSKPVVMNLNDRRLPLKGTSIRQELPSLKNESKNSGVAIGYQVAAVATKLPRDKLESKENCAMLTQAIQSSEMKPAKTSANVSLIRPALTSPTAKSLVKEKSVLSALTNRNSTTNSTSIASVPASLREPLAKYEAKTYRISPGLNKLRSKLNNSLSSNISGPPKQSKMPSLLENSSVNELPAVLESTNPPNFDSEQPYVVSTTIKPSIRPCPSRTAVKTDRNISHQPVARRSTVNIERVDILPPINIKQKMKMSAKDIPFWESIIISSVASQQPSELNTTNNAVDQPPKRPERRSSLTVISSSPIQAMKPMRRSSMTRENTSPESSGILRSGEVESPAKANKRTKDSFEETSSSNEKGNAKRSKLEQNRCSMNFSLSASVTEYIRSDLKTSKLDLDSLLRLTEPLESDAFENTLVEDQVKNATKMGSPQKEFTKLQIGVKPEMDALKEDLRLLKTVGLLVLKDSCFEDKLPFEQSESFRKTAAKFSKIYHTYDTIWSYRKTKTIGVHQRLTEQLNSFTEEVNREIDCHLTTNEIKRILNLINSWYAYQIDQRFFRKATLSYSVEHYMFLFHFLPKINPTVYFCECCEEIFPNEARYKKHVQSVHAVHAFTCSECGKSFKRLYFYDKHLKTVHLKP